MKSELSALDLHFLLEEFGNLVNGKLDKIYHKENIFLLQFHMPAEGKKLLKILLPNFIFLTKNKDEFPEPSKFCMVLRKYLGKSRLREVQQNNFERILEFYFEHKETNYILIVELFSKGNIILCREDYSIVVALDYHKWGQRTIRGGIKYEYPKKENNLLTITAEDLKKIIKDSKKESIVKTLAVDLSLGGTYAEELLSVSDINKEKKRLSGLEIRRLYESIEKIKNEKIRATLYKETDITPFELFKYKDIEKKSFNSFNNALDSFLTKKSTTEKRKRQESRYEKQIKNAESIIQNQKNQIEGLKRAYEESQKKGEAIYENYKQIEEILSALKKAREKYSWKEIKEKIKQHRSIKEINEKEGKIVLEL
ncbi:NFACT family protein [Candidatus Woesearchaeota archaeon]|nr:NFACT family protein [Candidatus Woesearchaeota archaeon]